MSQAQERFETQLTDLLIDKMKRMQLDYTEPWISGNAVKNIQSRPYSGKNKLLLNLAAEKYKWQYPVYTTFKMAKDEGISILKGSKSLPVIYYDNYYKHPEDNHRITPREYEKLSKGEREKYEHIVFAKAASVFNIAQTNIEEVRKDLYDKIVQSYQVRDVSHGEENKIDALVRDQAWYCPILHDLSTGAYYTLKDNEVHITPKGSFVSDEHYYSTLLHEMTHSTGHKDLLNRLEPARFGTPKYAREELVAELGSAISGAHLDLPISLMENHAAYLQSWIGALREGPEFLHTVLSDASQASNLIVKRLDGLEESLDKEQSEDNKANKTIGKETNMEEPITVRNEVRPYAELMAHREKMTSEYIDQLGEVPPYLRASVHEREGILRDLELNTDRERESKLLSDLRSVEDKVRTNVVAFVKEKYDYTLLTPSYDVEKLLDVVKPGVTDELDDSQMLHQALNDRLHITSELENTEVNRRELDNSDSEYEVTPNGMLKAKGVVRLQEGYTVQNTPQNRAFLQDNDISYTPVKDNKLFVSARAERVAILLAASIAFTPVVGMVVAYMLNRNKTLERLNDTTRFSKEESDHLSANQTIRKTVEEDGRKVDKYFFMDKDTMRLRSIPVREVNTPSRVNGVQLSPADVQSLREGKVVQGFDEKSKLYYEARIDMTSRQGVQMSFKEMKVEKEFKAVPTPNSPDAEKVAYVQQHGAQGVNDIWDRGGVNIERDSFLDKYDIEGFYKDYLKASQNGDHTRSEQLSEEIKGQMMTEGQSQSMHR